MTQDFTYQPDRPVSGYPVRPQAVLPSVATTVWITIFFGLFGMIPASMHSNQAQAAGAPTNKYWKAFGWTMGIVIAVAVAFWVLFWVILAASVNSTDGFLN